MELQRRIRCKWHSLAFRSPFCFAKGHRRIITTPNIRHCTGDLAAATVVAASARHPSDMLYVCSARRMVGYNGTHDERTIVQYGSYATDNAHQAEAKEANGLQGEPLSPLKLQPKYTCTQTHGYKDFGSHTSVANRTRMSNGYLCLGTTAHRSLSKWRYRASVCSR